MTEDRVFKTRAELLGGHYHVRVYSAKRPDHTFACLGTLVMDEADYIAFSTALKATHERTNQ
jgi:hypothetical protein